MNALELIAHELYEHGYKVSLYGSGISIMDPLAGMSAHTLSINDKTGDISCVSKTWTNIYNPNSIRIIIKNLELCCNRSCNDCYI
jgi:hypothetical protein